MTAPDRGPFCASWPSPWLTQIIADGRLRDGFELAQRLSNHPQGERAWRWLVYNQQPSSYQEWSAWCILLLAATQARFVRETGGDIYPLWLMREDIAKKKAGAIALRAALEAVGKDDATTQGLEAEVQADIARLEAAASHHFNPRAGNKGGARIPALKVFCRELVRRLHWNGQRPPTINRGILAILADATLGDWLEAPRPVTAAHVKAALKGFDPTWHPDDALEEGKPPA